MPRKTPKTDANAEPKAPPAHNWDTTDGEEIDRRRWRARTEEFRIRNSDARYPIFSNFSVSSGSGMTYSVEIHDIAQRQFHCQCVDFRINGLGTCKHVEAVLNHLEGRHPQAFRLAQRGGVSGRIDVIVDSEAGTLQIASLEGGHPPRALAEWFDADGRLIPADPAEATLALRALAARRLPTLRVSQEIDPWLVARQRSTERQRLRHEYEINVQRGEWPPQETKVPLFPYQREGMLHLAFTERALLGDEMGLGKTIQAIAACALLHRLGQARRVLVVTPASLKTEWEEQIQRFTDLPLQLVFGSRHHRLNAYRRAGPGSTESQPPFFTVVNYEQMLADSLQVNVDLCPDVVILDEAQRIKNWSAKTTQAIKRLKSRYAFVLTGTPIENRIDELYSLMDYLDPTVLGPLFRFNREYYRLDDRGRPAGYQNLERLQERIRPFLLRRRKSHVETQLPERTDRNHFVELTPRQREEYDEHARAAAQLLGKAARRPLTQREQDQLFRLLGMMRMTCDTNAILIPKDPSSSKLPELEKLLEECRDNPGVKVIVFSEWERMLEQVRALCDRLDLGHAWHTGSVPQKRRRTEINAFKQDPNCRIFLSTDSGSTGLNLQNASVVINCDLPWNPARLEQRIARAWRKHQTQPVTVINLVARDTLEERMLDTLAHKQALADGILDGQGKRSELRLKGSGQSFYEKLRQLGVSGDGPTPGRPVPATRSLPADRPAGFARASRERLGDRWVCCEERFPREGERSVLYVVVDRDAAAHQAPLASLHQEYFADQGPELTPQLEVIDRATHETIQRLIDAGLIARTSRAIRPLDGTDQPVPAPLNETERAQLEAHQAQADRQLNIARLLAEGQFVDESRGAILVALLSRARARAVENRLPVPTTVEEALQPPLAHLWGASLPVLRAYLTDATSPWRPVWETLTRS
jgi:superfamily II DNA or RNA helicase